MGKNIGPVREYDVVEDLALMIEQQRGGRYQDAQGAGALGDSSLGLPCLLMVLLYVGRWS